MAQDIELDEAFHRFFSNEEALDAKPGVDDPVKFRFGNFVHAWLGAISADRLTPRDGDTSNPRRVQQILVGFIQDRRDPNETYIDFRMQKPGTEDDANFKSVAKFHWDHVEFFVPVKLIAGGSGGEGPGGHPPTSFLTSRDGRYQVHMQGDGNLVVYDTAGTEGGPWLPVWDSQGNVSR